jgi:hypothetical protein
MGSTSSTPMTGLEAQILEWIADKTPRPELSRQLRGAEVARRDYVRTGYFVYLRSSEGSSAVEGRPEIQHPFIESPVLPDGAGCSLILKDGHLHYLEIYARGGFFPEDLVDYELRPAP